MGPGKGEMSCCRLMSIMIAISQQDKHVLCCMQDIALVESCPATFQSPYKPQTAPPDLDSPRQCVLLRAGGHLSVLDMVQGG